MAGSVERLATGGAEASVGGVEDASAIWADGRVAAPRLHDGHGQGDHDETDADDGRIDAPSAATKRDGLEFDGLARIHRGHLVIVARARVGRIARLCRPCFLIRPAVRLGSAGERDHPAVRIERRLPTQALEFRAGTWSRA